MIGSRDSAALPEQGDLFEERGNWQWPDTSQHDLGVENLEGLSDKDLVEKTAKATLSNVDLLCAQIVERGLGDIAVPGALLHGASAAHNLPLPIDIAQAPASNSGRPSSVILFRMCTPILTSVF